MTGLVRAKKSIHRTLRPKTLLRQMTDSHSSGSLAFGSVRQWEKVQDLENITLSN